MTKYRFHQRGDGMRYLAIACLLVLAACDKDPVATHQTDNPSIKVDDLFTHNGCTVSRFVDDGRNHYFADCRGAITSVHTESCGKGCNRTVTDETPTAGRE